MQYRARCLKDNIIIATSADVRGLYGLVHTPCWNKDAPGVDANGKPLPDTRVVSNYTIVEPTV